ncbi:ankyrin [Coprinopsis marcescibilis]|uniref:Ankyrin n=1 Tax=Coprinopsis marcescibilis TaxID=230819 RepID=A0A5C3KHZ4_COPMA|nr:ankyrin [Coprinopsis marcescibilis]
MHDHHSLRKTRPSKQDLVSVLKAIFTSNLFDERFCSLDGLDEAKSVTQFELLNTLSQLPVNLLIMSCPLHLLEDNIPTADHFSIILQDADIKQLIEEKVRQIPTLKGLLAKDKFKKWVMKTIIEKSSGMFLVASLQPDMLAVCINVHRLCKAVETLGGIDVALGNWSGWTALMLAVEGGSLEIVEMLLAVVETNHTSIRADSGHTALTLASVNGHVEVVKALFRFRSTNIKNLSQGDSSEEDTFIRECGEALVEAAENVHQDIVEILLGVKGINVNEPGKSSRTALMHVSAEGMEFIVEMLL